MTIRMATSPLAASRTHRDLDSDACRWADELRSYIAIVTLHTIDLKRSFRRVHCRWSQWIARRCPYRHPVPLPL